MRRRTAKQVKVVKGGNRGGAMRALATGVPALFAARALAKRIDRHKRQRRAGLRTVAVIAGALVAVAYLAVRRFAPRNQASTVTGGSPEPSNRVRSASAASSLGAGGPGAATDSAQRAPPRAANDGKPATKQELYEEAKRLGIPGRSSMTKAQLEQAVAGHREH